MPKFPSLLLLALLMTACHAWAHTAWLEADTDANSYLLRFGGHAGVLEPYDPEQLREISAIDQNGRAVAIERHDDDSGVRLETEGQAALITLFFDNGYWSRAPGGRSVNKPMDQVEGAATGVRAVKYHKYISRWSELASTAQGQPFELVPVSGQAPAAGEAVTFQVLIEGQPAAGIALAFEEAGSEAVSDEQGFATLAARAGINRIWSGQRVEVADHAEYSQLSTEYSLVFHAED